MDNPIPTMDSAQMEGLMTGKAPTKTITFISTGEPIIDLLQCLFAYCDHYHIVPADARAAFEFFVKLSEQRERRLGGGASGDINMIHQLRNEMAAREKLGYSVKGAAVPPPKPDPDPSEWSKLFAPPADNEKNCPPEGSP